MANPNRPDNSDRNDKKINGRVSKQAAFPDPWSPDLSFHLYGLNWDLSGGSSALAQQLRDTLAAQFSFFSANAGVEIAFDGTYSTLHDTVPSLSFGVWSSQAPSTAGSAARVRGLLGARSTGMGSQTGEIMVQASILENQVRAAIQSSPAQLLKNNVNVTVHSSDVTELPPAGFLITVAYDLADAPLPTSPISCSTNLVFEAVGGGIRVDLAPVDCGDFGTTQWIWSNLLAPGWFEAGLTGLLAFGYAVVQNIGSNLPALPNTKMNLSLGLPTEDLFPREIPAGPLKFAFTYRAPMFTGSKFASSLLRFPFAWAVPVLRTPTVTIEGPTQLTIPKVPSPPSTITGFSAVTADLVNPSFQWSLNGKPVQGNGALNRITLSGPQTYHVGVRAVDGMQNPVGATLEASADLKVVTKLGPVRYNDS